MGSFSWGDSLENLWRTNRGATDPRPLAWSSARPSRAMPGCQVFQLSDPHGSREASYSPVGWWGERIWEKEERTGPAVTEKQQGA